MKGKVKVGDRAPDFTLANQSGQMVSLHDFVGRQSVVLYFYPKDFTIGCTAEAKTFSANYDQFREMGAEVIGVSSDSVESHEDFGSKCNVSFLLLSDRKGQVRESYGVAATLGLIPGRITYIIDKDGVIRHIFSSQFNPKKHVKEALEILKSISNN
jgi:peroxiredoxin Q/BCP